MAKILAQKDGSRLFYCPGCKTHHRFNDSWTISGPEDSPTVAPSILVTYDHGPEHTVDRCHVFIRNGQIEYLSDCTHELAGKTVPMEEI